MAKRNKGSIGINVDAPTNLDSAAFSELAEGFATIMKAGFKNHLEQNTIQKALTEYANIIHRTPSFTISNCSIINGEVAQ